MSKIRASTQIQQEGATNGQALAWNGTGWVPTTISGGGGSGVSPYIARAEAYDTTPTATVGTWATANWGTAFPNSGFGIQNTSGAQNDAIAWQFPLAAGHYTINLAVRQSTNTGIVTVEIDGTSVGTLDTYNAAGGTNALQSLTGVSIAADGLHEIRLLMASKNASSAGYTLNIFAVSATRTGA